MEMFFPLSPNTKKSLEKVSAESLFLMNVVVFVILGYKSGVLKVYK